jgi:predicted metal-dependent peptidase
VICHEALHIILNHGIRISDAGVNRVACNSALDVVVNHTLVRNFGFDRAAIINEENLCWTDTVFKHRNPLPPDDEMFEFYYNLFEKVYGPGGGRGDGKGKGDNSMGGHSDGQGTVDDHSFMSPGEGEEESDDWDKVIDKLNEGISDEEKEALKGIVNKHFQNEGNPSKSKNSPAGTGTGGIWTFAGKQKVKKKKKWETVIKKWSKKYLKSEYKEIEQWARLNRRMTMLPRDMFLPSEMEIDDQFEEEQKIKVYFFLDTSGSCWGLKDRFFNAALSLPTDRFDVRLFCFDTQVQETTLESRKVYGGGGTAFDIIEKHVQKEKRNEEKGKYPEAVFVITDGYGTPVKPEQSNKWYWFLTSGGSKSYIPKDSNVFNLGDYE